MGVFSPKSPTEFVVRKTSSSYFFIVFRLRMAARGQQHPIANKTFLILVSVYNKVITILPVKNKTAQPPHCLSDYI